MDPSNSAVLGHGTGNGSPFTGLPKMGNGILERSVNLTYVSNQNETYYMNEYEAQSQELTRAVADSNGTFNRWDFVDGVWKSFLSIPRDDCDYYNHCDRNRVCTNGYYAISCRCLEGFENKSVVGCERKEPLSCVVGCERKEPLSCTSNQFPKEQSVKLPDTENATSLGQLSLEACKKLCLGDCSCVAYGCVTWRGDLLDLRSFTDGGDYLYVRLAESSMSKNWKKLVWGIVISTLLGIVLLCGVGVSVGLRP